MGLTKSLPFKSDFKEEPKTRICIPMLARLTQLFACDSLIEGVRLLRGKSVVIVLTNCLILSPVETIAAKAITGAAVAVATQKSAWKVIRSITPVSAAARFRQ